LYYFDKSIAVMSIITFPLSELNPVHPHLRRFNPRYDLRAISNLVEKCFDETLDAEGRRTIQQMRSAAGSHAALWRTDMGSESPYPFGGFVWEQDGALIGNLSLIPINARRRRITLVANVAVHPIAGAALPAS
jgi:hypothetical protein